MEVIYVLIAVAIGWILYKYFTGHGGLKVSRADLGGLPLEGRLEVRGLEIGWTATDEDSFAAAWPAAGGQWIAIRVVFDEETGDAEEDDQGLLDVTVGDRAAVRGAKWTDAIVDRGLRAQVEQVLRALASRAKAARAAANDASSARPVGTRGELE